MQEMHAMPLSVEKKKESPASPESLLRPAGGETVRQGETFELRWEVSIPTADGLTGSLWVSAAATEAWTLIADDLAVDSGRYVWDTAGVAPGQYRFGIRLDDGGSWTELIRSDWLDVL